jgi:hypothetical protein
MADYYFDGDPAVASTRRHLERVLKEPAPRKWPWFVGILAGGAALTFWRTRSRPGNPERADAVLVRPPQGPNPP